MCSAPGCTRPAVPGLQLQREAESLLPWSRRRSLGGFIAWAALQWKPPGEEKPRNGRDVDGTVYRNGVAVARRVKAKPARAGNTGRPGGRRQKTKKARR